MTINDKYDLYEQLLSEWNNKINLVAPSTLSTIRTRHIDDSAQLIDYIPHDVTVIDLGSGAGFPSVVLAILGRNVIAIESIGKKCLFLQELKSHLDLPNLEIMNDRVEAAIPKILARAQKNQKFVFTARAFANLEKILDLTAKYGIPYLLLKGQSADDEIAQTRRKYTFSADVHPSRTGDGKIIMLTHSHLV